MIKYCPFVNTKQVISTRMNALKIKDLRPAKINTKLIQKLLVSNPPIA